MVSPAQLAELRLFDNCRRTELKRISNLGTCVQVRAGRKLVETGRRGTEMMIIVSGSVACYVGGNQVASFGPGDFFGEIALLDGGPRTADVVAVTDAELLVLDWTEFEALLARLPRVAHRMIQVMSSRLRAADSLATA